MIFKVYKDGADTGDRIVVTDNEDAIQRLYCYIQLTESVWETDDRFLITEIKQTSNGVIIVELKIEQFEMDDEVQEISVWELVKDG